MTSPTLREALEAIRDGNVPRSAGKKWRSDGAYSKMDECSHGASMREDCRVCLSDYVADALAADAATPSHEAGRRAGLEEAAVLAETRHEQWRMPHPDDAEAGEVCCDVSACRDIATAIRNLAGDEGIGE